MRTLLTVGALALFGLAQPAAAQMCGAPGQQAQASTPAPGGAMGGMMCGGAAAAEDDPMADKPAAQPRQSSMCPCCRNMAMMRGGMGGMGGMQPHAMPGMEAPKPQ